MSKKESHTRVTATEIQLRLDKLNTGITLVAESYQGTLKDAEFMCAEGHTFIARTSHVYTGNSGCKVCSGLVRHTIESVQERVAHRGFKVLSEELNDQPNGGTLFLCPEGHKWETNFKNVVSKTKPTGCAVCAKLNQGQSRKKTRAEWQQILLNADRGDISIPGEPSEKMLASDNSTKFCCPQGHEWKTTLNCVVTNGTGCPRCSGSVLPPEAECREMLAERGIQLIGPMVKATDKTDFLCCVCAHEWSSQFSSVLRSSGCPQCAISRRGDALRLPLENVERRLAKRGIDLVGHYQNTDTPTQLRCRAEGHEWTANPNGYINGENPLGCPHCSNRALLTKEDINERIASRGLELVSEYVNSQTKAWFSCSKGHQWKTTPNSVLNGTGCPACSHYGTNADTVYIWKTDQIFNGLPVYKMGITTWHAKQDRVELVANKAGFQADLVSRVFVGAGNGYKVEDVILEFGSDHQYVGFDGHQEFRALSPKQLEGALEVMRVHEADLSELTERVSTPNHDIYSDEVLAFEHIDGKTYSGTRIEAAEELGIRHYAIRQMVDGTRWTSRGWGLRGWKLLKQVKKDERKPKATLYHKDGERKITGNYCQLAEAIGVLGSGVHLFLSSDNRYSLKGWGKTPDWVQRKEASDRKRFQTITLYDADGKQWTGLRREAKEQLGIESSALSQVTTGKVFSQKGWGLTPDWPKRHADHSITLLARYRVRSPQGVEHIVTRHELMEKFGLNKSWLDWRLRKLGKPDTKGWALLGKLQTLSSKSPPKKED